MTLATNQEIKYLEGKEGSHLISLHLPLAKGIDAHVKNRIEFKNAHSELRKLLESTDLGRKRVEKTLDKIESILVSWLKKAQGGTLLIFDDSKDTFHYHIEDEAEKTVILANKFKLRTIN